MNKSVIKKMSVYLPDNLIDNSMLEKKVNIPDALMELGTLEKLFGCQARRFAEESIQVSDIACEAANPILKEIDKKTVDLLIFAAASSDLIEPATANIIQAKLGLCCPVMDIKNACNSFVTAIQVSSAFIESGMYNNILVVSGEKLSEVINFNPKDSIHLKRCLAGYTLGDAGAAMLIGKGKGHKIVFQKFNSWGENWRLCTVEGGGSLAFRDFDKYFFEGNPQELSKAFRDKLPLFVYNCLEESGWKTDEIDLLVTHQVSSATSFQIAKALQVPENKTVNTFVHYGNIAATTIPVALNTALENHKLKEGDKVMLLGLAAGISISVQLIEW